MRTIIAGSRSISVDFDDLDKFIKDNNITITTILSGTARGIDRSGELYAIVAEIPLEKYPANWNQHGKAAGPIRNKEMAEKAEQLILIWNGKSPGSKSMKEIAESKGLKIWEWIKE